MPHHTIDKPGVRFLLAALLAWTLGASPAHAQPSPLAEWQFTPLIESVLSPPSWFTGSDGQVHLVYELLLTNGLPFPATVSTIAVMDAGTGATLQRLSGASLVAAMSLVMPTEAPTAVLPPASVGVVWFDVPLPSAANVPAFISHRVSIDPVSDVPEWFLSYTGPRIAVDRRAPVVLGPPVGGARWYAAGSCCDGPHRRALMSIGGGRYLGQRFAIDFNQLDAQNRGGSGDPLLPESFPTFGQPVLAVADATVAVAIDRYPDLRVNEEREAPGAATEGGNRIMLDLGDGRFAAYAHLQAGSVRVRPGDRVVRGQAMAKAGSSGTGGGPHVHFQVMDRLSVLHANGLPFAFDAFLLTGRTPPLVQVLPYFDTLEPIPISTAVTGQRRNALPLGGDVVSFPAAR
jgi:hypothetical protein